jgi:hypothetical protein
MKLSVLIPSRQEPYLEKTIKDIHEHAETDIEVFALEDDGRGQRALTNELARQATGDYVMKCDAHCSFASGFDTALLSEIDDRTILAPLLMPLDGPTWSINGKKQMAQFAFDTNFVMQHRDGPAGDTMCLQGSCFVVSRENYWKWNLGDETLPPWGGQGPELGIKAFLNGGRCKTTASTYYGHVFRHSDAEFPYDRGDSPGKAATEELKMRYSHLVGPLIERFGYPHDWTKEAINRGIIT